MISTCTVSPGKMQMYRSKQEFIFLVVSLIHQNKSACLHAVTQEQLLLVTVTLSSTDKTYLSSALVQINEM